MMPTLDDALQYADLGMRVIPTKPGSKRPAVKSLRKWRTTEPDRKVLWRWWQDTSRGMAVMLGDPSDGHAVRDFDDGDAYLEWACNHRSLAMRLPTCRTPRGWHVHFRVHGSEVQELSPSGSRTIPYADGELKAGGQAMLPPSRHPSGAVYEWERSPFDVEIGIPVVSDLVRCGLAIPLQSGINHVETSTLGSHPQCCTQDNTGTLKEREMDLACAVGSVEEAIECSLPSRPGERHRRLFQFARMLKSLPECRDRTAEDLKPHVREWWRRARPVVTDKDWLTSWSEFVRQWDAVRYPWGEYLMPEVVEMAIRAGCPSEVLDDCDGDPSGLAAGICKELARRGNGVFFLDCRTLGRHVGVAHRSAAEILRGLCMLGLLRRITKGTRGKASEYEYLGDWK